jgi:hypothetical protein
MAWAIRLSIDALLSRVAANQSDSGLIRCTFFTQFRRRTIPSRCFSATLSEYRLKGDGPFFCREVYKKVDATRYSGYTKTVDK